MGQQISFSSPFFLSKINKKINKMRIMVCSFFKNTNFISFNFNYTSLDIEVSKSEATLKGICWYLYTYIYFTSI